MSLDKIDCNILNQLQHNNRVSNLELAERVGLSPPACLKRVRRLRETNLIMADVSLVNPDKVGRKLNIIVEVEMERDHLGLYANFQNMVLAAPEVTQCYVVTGEVDFILVVSVPDMEAYDEFVRRVLYSDSNMRKFRSMISMSRLKYTTAIELKESGNIPV